MTRTSALVLALTLGCARTDVWSAASRNDAPEPSFCDANPGSVCDDGDPCTAESFCTNGTCRGTAVLGCVIADSQAEFSGVQGQNRWSYGRWVRSADTDGAFDDASELELMAFRPGRSTSFNLDDLWQPTDCPAESTQPGWKWTMLSPSAAHPNTTFAIEMPVRRWVSPMAGSVLATVTVRKSGSGGDGVEVALLRDGGRVALLPLAFDDTTGYEETVTLELVEGTVIDLVTDPLVNDSVDLTDTHLVIHH